MKVVCKKNDLLKALSIVSKGVNTTNTLAVLNNVLIQTEGDKLFFLTTNLDISIAYTIPVKIKEEGSITIPVKKLYEYISFLNDDEIIFEKISGEVLFIKSKSTKTKIKGISIDEFPQMPYFDSDYSLNISGKDFVSSLNKVVFACAINSIRPALTGVFLSLKKEKLTVVGSDSYRLSEKTISLQEKNNTDKNIILPVSTITEISRIIKEGDIILHISKNQVQFIYEAMCFTSRIINGTYPDYNKIIPIKYSSYITFEKEKLIFALKGLNVFAKENNFSIKIKSDKSNQNSLLTTAPSEIGEQETEVSCFMEGDDVEFAINSQHLLDIVNNIKSDKVIVSINEPKNPILITGVGDDTYRNIIMPLKI
jgi:DNA polymerase III subunit beta